MHIKELFDLISWDMRINPGLSFDSIRAKLLVLDIRFEQFIYRNIYHKPSPIAIIWYLCRFFGSIFQWFFCNSNIPGSTTIGKGLRLPHPQNIVVTGFSDIGEFCTIYQNVTIALNGFKPVKLHSPKIGSKVLLGTGSILVGDICVGSDVLIGAGTVVTHDIPDHSRVTSGRAEITERTTSGNAIEPGCKEHLQDPYGIWR